MTPARRLHHQRRRMSACIRMAEAAGVATVASLATHYAVKLNSLATMTRPCDAAWLAGQIGPNGIGPALDDVAAQARFAKRFPLLAIIERNERKAA